MARAGGIVIDTSAMMSILLGEPTGEAAARVLADAVAPLISAATVVELGIVSQARAGNAGAREASGLLRDVGSVVVPVDEAIAELAIAGWRTFGKGNHPAGLNFGDCFAYALARHAALPVLCVGDDFARTDIATVDLEDA